MQICDEWNHLTKMHKWNGKESDWILIKYYNIILFAEKNILMEILGANKTFWFNFKGIPTGSARKALIFSVTFWVFI